MVWKGQLRRSENYSRPHQVYIINMACFQFPLYCHSNIQMNLTMEGTTFKSSTIRVFLRMHRRERMERAVDGGEKSFVSSIVSSSIHSNRYRHNGHKTQQQKGTNILKSRDHQEMPPVITLTAEMRYTQTHTHRQKEQSKQETKNWEKITFYARNKSLISVAQIVTVIE